MISIWYSLIVEAISFLGRNKICAFPLYSFSFLYSESQLKPFPFWGVTRCGALLFHYTIEPFSFLYSDQMHRKTRLERWYRVLTITLCIGNTGRLCFPRLYQAFRVVTQSTSYFYFHLMALSFSRRGLLRTPRFWRVLEKSSAFLASCTMNKLLNWQLHGARLWKLWISFVVV